MLMHLRLDFPACTLEIHDDHDVVVVVVSKFI